MAFQLRDSSRTDSMVVIIIIGQRRHDSQTMLSCLINRPIDSIKGWSLSGKSLSIPKD